MSDKPNNPPAFPSAKEPYALFSGMSLRDYFAAAALQGFLAGRNQPFEKTICNTETVATGCYAYADYMLKVREQCQPKQ